MSSRLPQTNRLSVKFEIPKEYSLEMLENALELAYASGQNIILLAEIENSNSDVDTTGIISPRGGMNHRRKEISVGGDQVTPYWRPKYGKSIPALVEFGETIDKKNTGPGYEGSITAYLPILFLEKNNIVIDPISHNFLYQENRYKVKNINNEQILLDKVGFFNLTLQRVT